MERCYILSLWESRLIINLLSILINFAFWITKATGSGKLFISFPLIFCMTKNLKSLYCWITICSCWRIVYTLNKVNRCVTFQIHNCTVLLLSNQTQTLPQLYFTEISFEVQHAILLVHLLLSHMFYRHSADFYYNICWKKYL